MKPVWIVDDDKSIRWVLEKTLAREKIPFKSFLGDEALSRSRRRAAIRWSRTSACRVESGLDLPKQVQFASVLPVIIMTAYSDLDSAVAGVPGRRLRIPAKPFDVDQALELIRRAIDQTHQSGARVTPAWFRKSRPGAGDAGGLPRHRPLSQSNATVMITGESGTGKELVARACIATARAPTSRSSPSTPRRFRGPARIRTLRPRARRFSPGAGDAAARAL